ncbi:MAG: hypothetical protein ACLQVL_24275 [Terriglobia bacterium]
MHLGIASLPVIGPATSHLDAGEASRGMAILAMISHGQEKM